MSHESAGKTDDWYTPAYVFSALGERFDLDVAAPFDGPRHVPATDWFAFGGLEREWRGFVWMNPPFGHQSTKRAWLGKFFAHGDGVALLPDRTSAPWWQEFAPSGSALLFVTPKIKFERPDGTLGEQPGNGTTLMSAGSRGRRALERADGVLGRVFYPRGTDND